MIKFWIYLAKIIFFSFSTAFLIQALSDYGLRNSKINIFRHWESILNGSINSDVIIIGSSRGVVSYDPEIFNKNIGLKTFNLSFDGASYNLQNIKLKTYLKNNNAPKIVIMNVDMAHFNKSNSLPHKYQFLPFTGNNNLQREFKDVDSNYGKFYFLPLVKYNGSINYLKLGLINVFNKTYNRTNLYQAYSPRNKFFRKDEHNLERLEKLEKLSNPIDQYKSGLNSLEQLITDLPSETIVFLIWAPEHFERLLYAQAVREKVESYLLEIDNTFSNVHFLNYSQDSISLNKEFFYDTFHLNEKGAILFSKKSSKDIYELLN